MVLSETASNLVQVMLPPVIEDLENFSERAEFVEVVAILLLSA